jgi:hypothetical protein
MQYTNDACIGCGRTKRRKVEYNNDAYDDYGHSELNREDGTISDTYFWVCSVLCLNRVVAPYVKDKTYLPKRPPKSEYDEYYTKEQLFAEYCDWTRNQCYAMSAALKLLRERLHDEQEIIDDRLDEEYNKEMDRLDREDARQREADRKEDERLDKEEAREREADRREDERLEKEEMRQEEAERRIRLQALREADQQSHREELRRLAHEKHELWLDDRDRREAETVAKEREKQRKLYEEEAAKRAEDAKWQPKPFDL